MKNRKQNTSVSRRSRRKSLGIPRTPSSVITSVSRKIINPITKIGSDSGSYVSFRLGDFPSASEFTSLFTYYKIRRVELRFMLVNAPNNNADFPTLYIAPQDYVTGGPPTSRDEVLQYQDVQTYQFGPNNIMTKCSRVPTVTRDIGNQVGGGEIVKAVWLSTLNNSIQHLGFVYWLTRYNSPTDNSHTIEVEYTIHIDAKRTR